MPTPGTADYYALPISQRKQDYDAAQWMSGGLQLVPMEAYFSPSETAYFQAQETAGMTGWQDEVKKKYPSFAPYMDNPEIAGILKKATDQKWPPEILQSNLEASVWWKSHSDAQRQWYLLNMTDQASALKSVQQQYLATFDKARMMGFNLTSGQLMALSTQALSSGWNDQQLTQNIINANTGSWDHGTAGVIRTQLKALNQAYLTPSADGLLDAATKEVLAGTATVDTYKDNLAKNAMTRYQDPGIREALTQGKTLRDFADPYFQQASQTLGLNPNDMNFSATKWQEGLDHVDPKTGQRRSMTMDEWDQHIKMDPKYGYDSSENGMNAAAGLVGSIRQKFGVA
jgi:hypothetical protein